MKHLLCRAALLACLLLPFTQALYADGFWSGLALLWQPVWGKYAEGSATDNTVPLTTFNREKTSEKITAIRQGIVNTGEYAALYIRIYNNAIGSVAACSGGTAICEAARQGKDAAFVYLIGVDKDGNPLDETTNPRRSWFRSRAFDIFSGWNSTEDYDGKENQVYRAKELIMMIQAFDYLRMAAYLGADGLNGDDYDTYREQIFTCTYELYSRANNPLSGFTLGALTSAVENNMTLVVAAAVGMGAIAVNDRGTYWWAEQRKPARWASTANAFINNVMWSRMGSRANGEAHSAGYAEGPHYFGFAFEALLPYFQSFRNFTGGDERVYGTYYKCLLCYQPEYIQNYYADRDYILLYDWYKELMMPNGEAPTLDDSYCRDRFVGLAITGQPEHSILDVAKDPSAAEELRASINLAPDYLAIGNVYTGASQPENLYANTRSGDLIVRQGMQQPLQGRHYIHVNAERGSALNGGSPHHNNLFDKFSWGHEHGDVTSLLITAGEDVLALDPAYYGDRGLDNFNVNQGHHHNVITVDGEGPAPKDDAEYADIVDYPKYTLIRVKANYWNYDDDYHETRLDRKAVVEREVQVWKGDTPYYVVTDKVTNRNFSQSQWVQMNLNGNGNKTEGTCDTVPGYHNAVVWKHPCEKDQYRDDNWKMQASLTALIDNDTVSNLIALQTGSTHGNRTYIYNPSGIPSGASNSYKTGFEGNITKLSTSPNGDDPYGEHTRMTKQLSILAGQAAVFKTTIQVLPCTDSVTPPAKMVQNPRYTAHLLEVNDKTLLNYHYSRVDHRSVTDTIINPLHTDSTAVLQTDAEGVFFSWSKDSAFTSGNCLSYANFRALSLSNGDSLLYGGKPFVAADTTVEFLYYELAGRFRYRGTITLPAAAQVWLRVPDLEQGYQMIARNDSADGSLTSLHDKDGEWKQMRVDFPQGKTDFILELSDPCQASCFFPPTAVTIDTLFDFNTGTLEVLGHDLSCEDSLGWLRITNGSKMSICPGFVFHNKDSITLGECVGAASGDPEPRGGASEGGSGYGTPMEALAGARLSDHKRNMIIVNEHAGLVLDSGSHTHVGTFGTLLVKEGGTLLVKRGAMLEVGSPCPVDRGEVICQPGAFVCVEEGADLHFFADIDSSNYLTVLDTIDRHIFYVAMPHGGSLDDPDIPGAHAGVNTAGGRGKFLPDSVYGDNNCIAFCDWKVWNPPYGVNNREFGWCNVSYPVARFKSLDTVCPGTDIVIDAHRTLNETGYRITYCYYDVNGDSCMSSPVTVADKDSFWIDRAFIFTASDTGYYRIRLAIHNDCGERDSVEKRVYVAPKPLAAVTLPDSACPGYGTVIAAGTGNAFTGRVPHRWTVSLVVPDSVKEAGNNVDYGGDWLFDTATVVSDSFDFPGFRFVGGARYAVSLTVKGWCGDTTIWDTVSIPLRAFIDMHHATAYSGSGGSNVIQVHTRVTGQAGFTWTPSTGLSDPYSLNPDATVNAPVTYVLAVYDGASCYDYDTLTILHNDFAYAGEDVVICSDGSYVIGSSAYACMDFAPNPDPFQPPVPCECEVQWLPDYNLTDASSPGPTASPDTTTTYTLIVTKPCSNIIEYDTITVFVDTAIAPAFYRALQADSTVYFTNISATVTDRTTYAWDFGDGSPGSVLKHPHHTFPAFDSAYVVCMTATNACGSYTYCDTIHVDSAWLALGGLGKKAAGALAGKAAESSPGKGNDGHYVMANIPNPFSDETIIQYALAAGTRQAELRITTPLGQLVKSYALRQQQGLVLVDGTQLRDGLYYYTLIVDGAVAQSKVMVVSK